MEVLINDYPIDFELQGEKSVQEIVSSVSDWARERGLIFIELFINDKLYTIEEIRGKEFRKVDIINCVIESKSNLVFSTVDEGAFYCNKVVNFISSMGDRPAFGGSEVENLVSGMDWLREVLNNIANLMDLDTAGFRYKERSWEGFVKELQDTAKALPEIRGDREIAGFLAEKKPFFAELKELFRMTLISGEMRDLILKSIDSPDVLMKTLHELKGGLPVIIGKIGEAAVSFQTGKDGTGIDDLNEFVDFMLMYTRTCYQVVPVFGINPAEIVFGGISLEDRNARIMELLNDVIAAMENSDVVSLADILEYEIMPVTEGLESYIDALIDRIDLNQGEG